MKLSTRFIYFCLFVFSLSLLGFAFVLQYFFHLQPCPLCAIDRVLVIFISVIFLIACCHSPRTTGTLVYALLGACVALLGIAVTTRHLWLIQLPPERVPACTPNWDYLIETFPLKEVLGMVLKSSGECAKNPHFFLGLSLPAWTLIAFVMLAILSFAPYWLDNRQKKGQLLPPPDNHPC